MKEWVIIRKKPCIENISIFLSLTKTTDFGFVAVLKLWTAPDFSCLELSVQAVGMEKGTANSFLKNRINNEECLFIMPWFLCSFVSSEKFV